MLVHVLLYDAGKDSEGIHSLELNGGTSVLMFENIDDAQRYCDLLEAQDFPKPNVEALEKAEVEQFCNESGYEAKFVESGFIPKTEEELMFLAPPVNNRDVTNWNEANDSGREISTNSANNESDQLDEIRKRLEGLL